MEIKSEIAKIPVPTTKDEPQITLTLTGEKEIMALWNLGNWAADHGISIYGSLTNKELREIKYDLYNKIDSQLEELGIDKYVPNDYMPPKKRT